MKPSRREFLCRSGYYLSAAAAASAFHRFSMINAWAQTPSYKALVCIFLNGGNDGNNMVVPLSASDYQNYASMRNASGLGIAQASLLPITPVSIGQPFGLHPSLSDLQTLWQQQKLAVVCNVGSLVQPLTRQQYQSGAPRPYQLFSHSDQIRIMQTARADTVVPTGWGGRIADTFAPFPSGLPMITSISGDAGFAQGQSRHPLEIGPAPTALPQVLALSGFGAAADEVARRNAFNFLRTIDRTPPLVAAAGDATQEALNVGQLFTSDPTLATVFPNTALGNQLKQVAKVIKFVAATPSLGVDHQIFFCSLGGFDTHQNQVGTQANLLTQLSQAMKAFYDATVEIGMAPQVTTFTLSDFARTFQPSGSGQGIVGTDHAWGNHLFVMGGAVRGGDFYGVPGSNGTVFPTLQLSGPDDTDTRGRWIPTAALDQYAATLASWYGVSPSNIPVIFPLINRFPPGPNLGFMM